MFICFNTWVVFWRSYEDVTVHIGQPYLISHMVHPPSARTLDVNCISVKFFDRIWDCEFLI